MADKLPISLVAIVRNANGRIRKLIENHRDIVSEVVIVDQGSTDGTYEEAMELADVVFRRRCKGTSDPDRNWAFALAKNPYVLYLDDDEILSNKAKEAVVEAVKTDADAFWFKRTNLVDGVDINEILGDDPQCRLFRKGAVRFSSEIHRFPEVARDTKVFHLDCSIIHERSMEQLELAHKNRDPIADKKTKEMQNHFIAQVKELVAKNKGFTENWYSDTQLEKLKEACKKTPLISGQILEIGCWEGKSTCTIANEFPKDVVQAVDTWVGNTEEGENHPSVVAAKERDVYTKFMANVVAKTAGNVVAHKQDCFEYLKQNKSLIKFCHIDAAHDYKSVKDTIVLVKAQLVKGAVLCGDDFMSAGKHRKDLNGGVARAVEELCPGFVSQENFWYWINK